VVKVALDDTGVESLQREMRRLDQARHPGVVELLNASEGRLELRWAGSHTLETTRPPVPVAAGLLAAVATTVADLHAMGVVHGRIEPSHVVVDGVGRPVLCGFGGPEPTAVGPGPADDVAAVGRLIDHLLGPEAEPEPIPDRRWIRRPWAGYDRRALQLLADRATHEDPARRPTARALANAIIEAVPKAHLDPPLTPRPGTAPTPEPDNTTEPDPRLLDEVEQSPPSHRTDDDPAPAVGSSDGRVQREPRPDPLRAGPFIPRVEACADAPEPVTTDPPAGSGLGPVEPPRPRPVEQPDDTIESILGLRLEPSPVPAPGDGDGRFPRPGPEPAPGRSRSRGGRRAGTLIAAGALSLTGLSALVLTEVVPGPTPGHAVDVSDRPVSAARPRRSPQGDQGTDVADLTSSMADGDGEQDREQPTPSTPSRNPEAISVDDGSPIAAPPSVGPETGQAPALTVVAPDGVSYQVGQPGDVVTVGDWNCDGSATPGVVRPATGEVFLFDRWADPNEPVTVEVAITRRGATALEAPGADCPAHLVLEDGSRLAIRPGPTGWMIGTTP